jgi:cysteinyl-tRNA synthetase, unknown class
MTSMIPYLYQLQNTSFQNISSTSFKIGVFDADSTGMTSAQLDSLNNAGKTILTYLSIGEAEDYRSYWQDSWNSNPPSWIVDQNSDWGSYRVKFWDPAWQKIVIDRAVQMAKTGYNGLVMDVVDVYEVSSVRNAYNGSSTVRQEMINFVGKISDATKAINPHFKIVQNNALTLLTTNGSETGAANTAYMSKIDGVNAESTFYLSNNSPTSWKSGNLQYLSKAVNAGMDVFAMDYPTDTTVQAKFISEAIAEGFVPFATNQNLSQVPSINYQTWDKLPVGTLDSFLDTTSTTPPPTSEPTDPTVPTDPMPTDPTPPTSDSDNIIIGSGSANNLSGIATRDQIYGNGGNDTIHGNGGNDYIQGDGAYDTIYGDDGNDALFGNAGNDALYGGAGNDYMSGGTGSDRLEGGAGDDVLYGNDGTDLIFGGAGNDDLYGGIGNDKFHFTRGGGDDVINDFQGAGATRADVIYISSQIYTSKSQIMSHITYSNGDAVIELDNGNSITVAGVSNNAMASTDFVIY